ncbi:MAG: GAF domain-containing sensor histidine kinase [Elusimicrobia bacterium]|nr:GAF domain-containing sensor histidine kinase [Elusimicrobiota bacterium]
MNNVAYPIYTFDFTPLLILGCVVLLAGLIVSLYFLIGKNEDLKEIRAAYNKILEAFNELDEQAKLIVKTDLELNKAQEELDRRLTGLNILQKMAQKMNMTLDDNEVFQRFDQTMIAELGFSKGLIATLSDEKVLTPRVNIGMASAKIETFFNALAGEADLIATLQKGVILSSLRSSQTARSLIVQILDAEHFILSPLLTQKKLSGILFVGNNYNAQPVTEGDEEIISILANQLAQAGENAQLFEQVYRSSQILEMKVAERTKELTLALKNLEEVSKKKSEFISAVSHELRTPLTSIKGYAAILMTGKVGEIPEPVKERLAKINLHSDNLVKLINDLLDIARIESGRVEMRPRLQPLKPLLDNIADLLTPQLGAKNITIKLSIPDDIPAIEIDQGQIERVFINLLSNAIKFTPEKGSISVNVIPRPDQEKLTIEVADSGIGIKKEDLGKIFDEFYRAENEINMNVKGTGLGLALVRNIVAAHHGRIWVSSEPGAGTTFHFTLPYKHINKKPEDNKTEVA